MAEFGAFHGDPEHSCYDDGSATMSEPFPPRTTYNADFFAKVAAGQVAICRLEEPALRDRSDGTFKDWLLHIDLPRRVIYRIGALRPDGIVYDADREA